MYKYLAMDNDGAFGCEEKPVFEYGFWSGTMEDVEDQPTFLRPGQLWERVRLAQNDDEAVVCDWRVFDGYWWEKTEDNSEKSSPLEDWVVYPVEASNACRAAGLSLEALKGGVVAEMVKVLKLYANEDNWMYGIGPEDAQDLVRGIRG